MPPRRSKKRSRFDLIPPGGSFEDDAQLDDLRHTWSLTFGELLTLVEERYGYVYRERQEGGMLLAYLESADGEVKVPAPRLDLEDPLDPETTQLLCLQMGLPPEDFGLATDGEPSI